MSRYWPNPIEQRLLYKAPAKDKVVDLVDIEDTHSVKGLSAQMPAVPLPRELVSLPGTPVKEDTGLSDQFVIIYEPTECGSGILLKNLERIYPVVHGYEGISMSATSFNLSVSDAMKFDMATADFINRFPFDCAKVLMTYRIAVLNVLLKAKWDVTTRRIAVACRRGCCLLSCSGTRDRNSFFVSVKMNHTCAKHNEERLVQLVFDVTGMPWLDPRMTTMFCDTNQCYTLDFFVQTFMS